MKETSEFKKVDHLPRFKIEEWLKIEKFSSEEIKLIWEYLEGSIPRLLKVIRAKKKSWNLEEFLKQEAWLAYTEIVDYLIDFSEEKKEYFYEIAKDIVRKGYYSIERINNRAQKEFLQKWAEKEILFYDLLELKVTGNSRVYEKGLEILLRENK